MTKLTPEQAVEEIKRLLKENDLHITVRKEYMDMWSEPDMVVRVKETQGDPFAKGAFLFEA